MQRESGWQEAAHCCLLGSRANSLIYLEYAQCVAFGWVRHRHSVRRSATLCFRHILCASGTCLVNQAQNTVEMAQYPGLKPPACWVPVSVSVRVVGGCTLTAPPATAASKANLVSSTVTPGGQTCQALIHANCENLACQAWIVFSLVLNRSPDSLFLKCFVGTFCSSVVIVDLIRDHC